MSAQTYAPAWARKITHGANGCRLTPSEKLLLLTLATYYSSEEQMAWPSVNTLAEQCQISDRQVHNLIRRLAAMKLIRIERRHDSRGGLESNGYRLELDRSSGSPKKVDDTGKVTATSLKQDLLEVLLPAFLRDHNGAQLGAYLDLLDAGDVIAAENGGISANPKGYFRNEIMKQAAWESHMMTKAQRLRLCKEAKVLGPDGHKWIVVALWTTTSADIQGDKASYVIKVARSTKAERSGGGAK